MSCYDHPIGLVGVGISAIGSGWSVLADVSTNVGSGGVIGGGFSDATLISLCGTFTAIVLPILINTYKKAKAAKHEVEVNEFSEYKILLMGDLKALREENAALVTQVAQLKAEIISLRNQISPKS